MRPFKGLAKHRDGFVVPARVPVANPRIFGSPTQGAGIDVSDPEIPVGAKPKSSSPDRFRIEDSLATIPCDVGVDVQADAESGLRPAARIRQDAGPL